MRKGWEGGRERGEGGSERGIEQQRERGCLKFLHNVKSGQHSSSTGSVAFTDGGRHYGDSDYGKKLYGAFTGPM